MKSSVFWDITPCSLLKVYWGSALLAVYVFHGGFLLAFFIPEDRGDMFLRNVFWFSMDYTALYPRRQHS
jgi:hypothetical protein